MSHPLLPTVRAHLLNIKTLADELHDILADAGPGLDVPRLVARLAETSDALQWTAEDAARSGGLAAA